MGMPYAGLLCINVIVVGKLHKKLGVVHRLDLVHVDVLVRRDHLFVTAIVVTYD
jgi:hypothetical protein